MPHLLPENREGLGLLVHVVGCRNHWDTPIVLYSPHWACFHPRIWFSLNAVLLTSATTGLVVDIFAYLVAGHWDIPLFLLFLFFVLFLWIGLLFTSSRCFTICILLFLQLLHLLLLCWCWLLFSIKSLHVTFQNFSYSSLPYWFNSAQQNCAVPGLYNENESHR